MNSQIQKSFIENHSLQNSSIDEDCERYKRLMFKVYEVSIINLWSMFEQNKFEPILIKGWSAAMNYSKPFLRQIGDVDIAVNPELYEKALQFKNELGYQEVDLHKGLRHLDKLSWDNIFANSRIVDCGDEKIRVLRPEDHLRILCVHWLTDGGINKEKLWDIYYAVENRPENFDWDRFLNSVGEKRRKWLVCAIGITHKYLGLKIENTPVAKEAKKIPKWVVQAIEREWQNDIKFKYLETTIKSKTEFLSQLKKRFPPNPIQSTINMEGDFDEKPRIIYQFPDMVFRFIPSINKFLKILFSNLQRNSKAEVIDGK
jgi:hypothetical protein